MTGRTTSRAERRWYEIRLSGHLDAHWSTWFGGFAITHEVDGTTTLRGLVTDQAELHGLLARVRDLGVTMISLAPLEPDSPWTEPGVKVSPSGRSTEGGRRDGTT